MLQQWLGRDLERMSQMEPTRMASKPWSSQRESVSRTWNTVKDLEFQSKRFGVQAKALVSLG